MPVHHSLKTQKDYKNSNKQEIHNTFIKANYIKLAFNKYGDFKHLPRRAASDKVFNIVKNPKNDGYQRDLPQ